MSELEKGLKWWLRYVIVPMLAGGGVLATLVAFLLRPPTQPSISKGVERAPAPPARSPATPKRPMDIYLSWNTVIPGPLLEQLRFPDSDYNSCLQACESRERCQAWVFGPMPLPAGVRFNCGLKLAVTGDRVQQANVVSGYASRYRP